MFWNILSYVLWTIFMLRVTLPVLLADMSRNKTRYIVSNSLWVTIPIFLAVVCFMWFNTPHNAFYLLLSVSMGYYIQKGIYLRMYTNTLDITS